MASDARPSARFLALASVACVQAACLQGVVVDVEHEGVQESFIVRRGAKTACVDMLDVYAGEPRGNAPAWRIATADPDLCVGRFVFGRVPPGFAQDAPAPPLVRGGVYHVEVSGTGFVGARRFVVEDR